AAASIPTTNGGGQHGHVGLIIDDAEYTTFSHNAEHFIDPVNPGPYPTVVDNDAVVRERQIAEHKAEYNEFLTCEAVKDFLRKSIVKSVDEEWIVELASETMGYQHRHPRDLIQHLRDNGSDLDHMDVKRLLKELQEPSGQAANPDLRLALMLATVEESGEYDAAVREWKNKDPAHKTFTRFRGFIQKEFALRHKNNKSTAGLAGHGIANSAQLQEQEAQLQAEAAAYAIQEVANAMQQKQDKQFEQMMEMFKAMMQAQGNNNGGSNAPNPEKPQLPKCKHCNRRHKKKESECWELEANKDKRPAGYKTLAEKAKST
ncbi:hypothetical protein ACHAW6_008694, partial [Cyclotella cf. meneghiniana]